MANDKWERALAKLREESRNEWRPERTNVIVDFAREAGRDYVIPEDVQQAVVRYANDPHLVRIDVLEVLGGVAELQARDVAGCARVAYEGAVAMGKK